MRYIAKTEDDITVQQALLDNKMSSLLASIKKKEEKEARPWTEDEKKKFIKEGTPWKVCSGHLKELYGGVCCYCQCKDTAGNWDEVEHFYPKDTYMNLVANYRNLHYSCKKCNMRKLADNRPLLSPNYYTDAPANANPIWRCTGHKELDKSLKYHEWNATVLNGSQEAKNVIELLDLNNEDKNGVDRSDLYEARKQVYQRAYKRLKDCRDYIATVSINITLKRDYDLEIVKLRDTLNELRAMMLKDAAFNIMIIQNFHPQLIRIIGYCKMLKTA